MQQDQFAVGGQADVELDPTAAERLGPAQSAKRIFRGATGCAAVTDDRRERRHRGKCWAVPPDTGRQQRR